ncbi:MAG TPA: class I SAM-dependent methyltransferase [Candidatus Methylacidiphilales bacterium]|jgi:S-adenosylmethionine-diacylgycerolhomoserine-N-methlytransferase|nr:class I SAM-dependent methyltransferase [Candidatus Methylacidiphilales bacterium]
MATTEEMDAMYRWTRYVYDLTRKYYLLGRDRLLRDMILQPGDRVLEIGCGTARNLIRLAKQRPDIRCFGLDASTEMLATATAKVKSRRLEERITLAHCLAEELDYAKTFGLNAPFDAAFFSYSLSMIPTWPQAVDAALANLKRGAALYVVDFWDQGGWPRWFRFALKRWLDLFHVVHRPELLDYLRQLDEKGLGTLTLQSVAGRYAYLASFRKM